MPAQTAHVPAQTCPTSAAPVRASRPGPALHLLARVAGRLSGHHSIVASFPVIRPRDRALGVPLRVRVVPKGPGRRDPHRRRR